MFPVPVFPRVLSVVCLLFCAALPRVPAAASEPVSIHSAVVMLIDDVSVASPQGGLIQGVLQREGSLVQQGAALVELDDAEFQLDCRRLRAQLEFAEFEADNLLKVQLAQKALGIAAAELERAEKANETFASTVSVSELDKLRFSRDQAQLQIENAQREQHLAKLTVRLKRAELDLAELRLERRCVRAPLGGMIVRIERQPGEWIQPGEPLCRLIRTDRVRVEGFVNVADGTVRPGQAAEVRLTVSAAEGSTVSRRGQLTFVDPEINPITGLYRVWAEFENSDGTLRPGHRPTAARILPSGEAGEGVR